MYARYERTSHTAGISAASIASVTCAAPRRSTPVSRISRCASRTGIDVRTIIANAITLTTGSCWPSRMYPRMRSGIVFCDPAVNVVTMT